MLEPLRQRIAIASRHKKATLEAAQKIEYSKADRSVAAYTELLQLVQSYYDKTIRSLNTLQTYGHKYATFLQSIRETSTYLEKAKNCKNFASAFLDIIEEIQDNLADLSMHQAVLSTASNRLTVTPTQPSANPTCTIQLELPTSKIPKFVGTDFEKWSQF